MKQDWSFKLINQSFPNGSEIPRVQEIRQNQRKFIAPHASNRIFNAGFLYHYSCRSLKHMITRSMSKRVIHIFEEIEVNLHDCKTLITFNQSPQHVVNCAAIF